MPDRARFELNSAPAEKLLSLDALLGVDPRLDPLRGDARFADLLRRIGLPTESGQSRGEPRT